MTAQIISLCERRKILAAAPVIDIETAVDVVIRDLRDIAELCETEEARLRIEECRDLLMSALGTG